MQVIRRYIDGRASEIALHPLFGFLRNQAIDPAKRFAFAASSTHFILTYSDILRFVLTQEPAEDRYQEMVNAHCAEERLHSRWFLADLTTLGQDPHLPFTDAAKLLWSDETVKTRVLGYELAKLGAQLRSIERLVLLETIEAMSALAFESSAPAATELEHRAQKRLVFFGQQHLDSELSHAMDDRSVRQVLAAVQLDQQTRERLTSVVDTVFSRFVDYFGEMLTLAQGPARAMSAG